ncbi:hypothetical protein KAI78_03365 [bacterium]|nr:hypothetical protein [bacterium]
MVRKKTHIKARIRYEMAGCRIKLGDLSNAESDLKYSTPIFQRAGDIHSYSKSLLLSSSISRQRRDFSSALRNYTKLIKDLEDTDLIRTRAACYFNMAAIYRRLGRIEKSFQVSDQAKKYYEQLGDDHALAQLEINRYISYVAMEQYDRVQNSKDWVLKVIKKKGTLQDMVKYYASLTSANIKQGYFTEALKDINRMLKICHKNNMLSDYLNLLLKKGYYFYYRGYKKRALAQYKLALEHINTYRWFKKLKTVALFNLGTLSFEVGNIDEAEKYMIAAMRDDNKNSIIVKEGEILLRKIEKRRME